MHKTRHSYRDRYKARRGGPDTGLITDSDLTAGNTGDTEAAPGLLDDEPAGTELLDESAYGTGELRHHLQDRHMTAVIKPSPLRPAVEGGYTFDDLDIDETARTITCPPGSPWRSPPDATPASAANARPARCGTVAPTPPTAGSSCCTAPRPARRRGLGHDRRVHTTYRRHRPTVERSIAWLVRGPNRRLRYRGIERNRTWLAYRVAAVNLGRLVNLGLTHGPTGWAIA